jgi:hypothetical protein
MQISKKNQGFGGKTHIFREDRASCLNCTPFRPAHAFSTFHLHTQQSKRSGNLRATFLLVPPPPRAKHNDPIDIETKNLTMLLNCKTEHYCHAQSRRELTIDSERRIYKTVSLLFASENYNCNYNDYNCNYIQRALLTNSTTSKLQVQQLSMRSKHLCTQNHKLRELGGEGGGRWGGGEIIMISFQPPVDGGGHRQHLIMMTPPIKSPSPLSRCHVASSDKCIEGSVAPSIWKAPSLGWGALPLPRLSYMTDGGENLSYNDVTDGRTVGHVH